LTFSRIDHAKVAMANDAMMRLEQSTGALKRQLSIDFAPLFTVVADTITDAMIGATSAVNDHTRALATTGETYGLVAESVFWLADRLDLLGKGIRLHALRFQEMSISALEAAKSVAELFAQEQKARELTATIDKIKAGMAKTAISLGVDMAMDETLGDKMRARYQEILDKVNQTKPEPLGDGLIDLDALKEQQRQMEETQRRAEMMTQSLRTPYEVLPDRIVDANKLLDLGAISWQTYGREIAAARKEFERAQDTFSGGPKLVERGTQAGFASLDRWNAMQKRMAEPFPGKDLVRKQPPASAPQVPEVPRSVGPTADRIVQVVPVQAPQPPVIPDILGLPVDVSPQRSEERDERRLRPDPPAKDDTPKQEQEMLDTLKRMEEKLAALDKIASETAMTTDNTHRIARGVEELEMPEVMEA